MPIIPRTSGSPLIQRNRLTDLARPRIREFDTSYTAWEPVGPPGSVALGTYEAEFKNGWANVGGAYPPLSFHLSEDGKVYLRGAIDGGDVGTVITTLPEYARPEFSEVFVCAGTNGVQSQVQIDPTGDVTFLG